MDPFHKRDVALDVIARFKAALASAPPDIDIGAVVSSARAQLDALQGDAADRPYLARSVCQMSTLLRRRGWHQAARELVAWAERRGVVDTYLLTELVQCQVAAGDLAAAERTREQAHAAGMLSEPIYT